MSIIVSDLTKIYGAQKALDGISFEVKPGEILGFLGPNGAGKSTTMKILTGYLPQHSGSASICGYDVNTQSMEARKRIGYLPELNPLYTDMYIKEYLLFSAGLLGLTGEAANTAVETMIQKTGLTPERKKQIAQLSKGYKQRVGLAAAMLHNPEVLILDEPTSGLDPNQVVEIRNLIKEIGKDKTVLFSTHIMQEVEAMCTRVIIINKGKIVANDAIENLQKKLNKTFILTIEFKDEINESLIQSLAPLVQTEKNGKLYKIKAQSDLREAIAKLAQQNNWLILSMQLEESSLEEVFQSLTQ
ncbi:MAG: gliding motility-associated ABC transporter ATP-binding subunit GldA [Bacteroidia bacterium]|nr:gliding motility-associated ABC transporter ATP-binding subunit GldA [Bacteroidia bacterium]MCF8426464.1 gliding motility-associated ABC transporter ATP-binding subunit GldA [Bacteroidia bacterium]MCF8446878.1 gliding motility-associated ABC transporter ATP-binding subunit GldA [Bacteroidia bacterium]